MASLGMSETQTSPIIGAKVNQVHHSLGTAFLQAVLPQASLGVHQSPLGLWQTATCEASPTTGFS